MKYWSNVFAMIGAACMAIWMLEPTWQAFVTGLFNIVFGFIFYMGDNKP